MTKQKQKFAEADDTPVVYCNTAQVSSSHYDFRFRFGLVQDEGEPKLQATVYLAPGHAKALAVVLLNQIARFEDKMGAISTKVKETVVEDPSQADDAKAED